jgi:predicted CXXCH cytochrome family protein
MKLSITTGRRMMKTYASCIAALLAVCLCSSPLPAQPRVQQSVCVDCHLEMDIPELTDPVTIFMERENGRPVDVHARAGYSCHDCHGGNPHDMDRAKDPRDGYIGKPSVQRIQSVCGDCHGDIEYMRQRNPRLPTDQLRLYETSDHGKALEGGNTKVATCVSCHGSHSIRRSDDPVSPSFARNIPNTCAQCHSDSEYMAGYAIPTDQLEKYKRSEHGRLLLDEGDIGAPACNTCHGNHGAAPPRVAAVHQVCGQCHAQHDEYFEQSTHAEIFEMMDMPGCATCHGYHEIPTPSEEMLSNEPGSICMTCHVENDPCFMYVENIRGLFGETKEKLAETEELLKRAEVLGMGVQQAQFNLAEVRDHFIRARIRIHQFEEGPVEEELEGALNIIQIAHGQGEDALRDWQMRRVGLAVSLLLIVVFVAAMVTKIRQRDT